MRSPFEIKELLDELNHQPAYALEDQDLDFKEWNSQSISEMPLPLLLKWLFVWLTVVVALLCLVLKIRL